MSTFEEPPLFGEQLQALSATVAWPPLPREPWWRRFHGGPGDRCDYCVRQCESTPLSVVRRAGWHRTGLDGAVLLLCDEHGQLFADERSG